MSNQYKIKVKSSECSMDELEFAFSQVKDLLASTNQTFDSNSNKTYVIVSILSGISIGLLSYTFQNHDFKGVFNPMLFSCFIMSITSLGLSIYLSIIVLGNKWKEIGSVPSELINPLFYNRKMEKEDKGLTYSVKKAMIYSELHSYEKRVRFNLNINKRKSDRINNSIIGLVSIPLVGVLFYLIGLLVKHLWLS